MASTPKTMSNRLMTMKFMQRSAAKSAKSEPSTPDGPHSKKVRLSNGRSAPSTPGTPSDHEVLKAVLDEEEKKRQEAVDRAAEKAGETKWVLSFKDPNEASRKPAMNVVQAGFAVIDADDDSDDEGELQPARMTFGGGVKREQKKAPESDDNSDDSAEESDSSELDSDDPTAALIRETKREMAERARESRKAEKRTEENAQRRPKPIDQDMDLANLTSISGGRPGGSGGGGRDFSTMQCFGCGQVGHRKQDCPNGSNDRGRGFMGRGGRGGRNGRR
ncbi:hypothetical protein BU24DRAFT_446329 [Aaosphaeria arxii CBS 175.79]|uniref:CCHC-type domain-containing protein n=1 Tax=Aaosphaeria arxii CBS 175.79 TaxID=1450172 RepID=A0A6A5Y7K1_9PLEO|nr:uncharacterized protein BU24DRAFT_446329 [Aaosphaeria arxii CBS 175.79]KAF2021276.1 hypothetical protein BU24DRAFT_446329 [Aaosphaeria arxii CBS 175.79]